MSLDRLRRVTDLFDEGTILPLGMDPEDQSEIVVWINKLNSFEVEEARRDGVSARALRVLELEKEDNPQRLNLTVSMRKWSNDRLAEQRVGQLLDDQYLEVLNDIESDEKWREKVLTIRRLPDLLVGAAEDDPRRGQLTDLNEQYLAEIRSRSAKKQEELLREVKDQPRTDVEQAFIDEYINRMALDDFMAEQRVTAIFMAVRDCRATRSRNAAGEVIWEHADCDHTQRLFSRREDVRTLSESLIARITDVMDGKRISDRDAGFSDAPASSSASSERPSEEAADSQPSTPVETPPAAPTS